MDVDTEFPHLSWLAMTEGKQKQPLSAYVASDWPGDNDYWTLRTALRDVINRPADLNHLGSRPFNRRQHLRTLDEAASRLPSDMDKRRLWKKVSTGKGNQFLDTVVEAAWALYFLELEGCTLKLEERFPQAGQGRKNADFLVTTVDSARYWLDAKSFEINLPGPKASMVVNDICSKEFFAEIERVAIDNFVNPRQLQRVPDMLARKAKEAYNCKFGRAVPDQSFKGEFRGILLCVVKSEDPVLPAAKFDCIPPPPGLLDDAAPGLNLVWVHTLRAPDGSQVLRPKMIGEWQIAQVVLQAPLSTP
jgi:hypothetical protein